MAATERVKIDIVTLFPEMCSVPLGESMMGRAQAMTGLASTQVENFCASVRQGAQGVAGAAEYQPGAIL